MRVQPMHAVAMLLGCAQLVFGACGSASRRPVASTASVLSPLTESLNGGARGGTLTVFDRTDFQGIDPGSARSVLSYEVLDATQRPLFSYEPDTLAASRPDLAASPPTISPDGKTVTIRLRHGVHFSPPVNREVTSADVAYAIERGANPRVGNPYFKSYFDTIKGARSAEGGTIPGIATPRRDTIVFHLTTNRQTRLFVDALALPVSAPVPKDYARKYDAEMPSRYGEHQVATGPYMFKADKAGGVIGVGYLPRKRATLIRNPSWRPNTDFRPAHLDQIDIVIGGDPHRIGNRVLEGSHLVQNDPVSAVVRAAHDRFRGQLQVSPDAGTSYIATNNRRGPLSNTDVRKALWAALDRLAMSRLVGQALASPVATHFLYPGIPGFALADTMVSRGRFAYNEHSSGDMAVATRYMRHAGYPAGRYTGRHAVVVVGAASEPARAQTWVVERALRKLGFQTSLHLLGSRRMRSMCSAPANEIDVCPNALLAGDFPDGQAVLDTAFNGRMIRPHANKNWGQVDSPNVNAAIEREAQLRSNPLREQGWAAVDNGLVVYAVAIPYAWTSEPAIESRDVSGVGDLWNAGAWDYSFTSLR